MDGTVTTANEPGIGLVEKFRLEVSEERLLRLLTDLFEHHWDEVVFGSLIQGAVFELRATQPPKLSMLDGYLTVKFGESHFHLCIGEHRGTRTNPVDPELARHRRTARAEFFRIISPGEAAPTSWGFRMFNGAGEQQMTVFLPNPFLTDDMKILKEPRWERLALWDELRQKHLGVPPDPMDRSAARFWHP